MHTIYLHVTKLVYYQFSSYLFLDLDYVYLDLFVDHLQFHGE